MQMNMTVLLLIINDLTLPIKNTEFYEILKMKGYLRLDKPHKG